MPETTPPDNLRPVDPNTPLGGIIPSASPDISRSDKPGESTAEIPQGGVQQPEVVSGTKPAVPATADNSFGSGSQETKSTLPDTEWKRILNLGEKSFLDLKPEEIAELQNLTLKGKGLLGDDFNQELSRRNTEAKQQKKDRIDKAFREITEKFNSGAQALLKDTKEIINQGDARVNAAEATMRQNIANIEQGKTGKTYEEVLGDLQKDPQHSQAIAEIQWLDLQMGKLIPGVNPELQKRINDFRQNATQKIMADPKGYEQDLQALKAEFFKFRGINPQDQPKTNAI